MIVLCDYCGRNAELVTGATIYPHRSDLKELRFWRCAPCDAYVGCHNNSKKHAPLGRLANAELRQWKVKTHAVFDPIWKALLKPTRPASRARKTAYAWLAKAMDIPARECHIGMFDICRCKRAIACCQRYPQTH